jgi:preprotein translocase subunit YajC
MHTLFFAFSNNPQGQQGGSSLLVNFIPIILIFIIFYLLLILPQQKKQKQHMKMMDSLRKGDRVVTNAGIYGTVADVKENIVVLRIAEEVKIELMKSAVAAVLERKEE